MRVNVQKWGNSLALRIPKAFAEEAAVTEGSLVDLSVSEGRLVAVPVRRKKIRLKQLLRGVKRGNLHREIDYGPASGREVW
jgi:antitoxin MazE